MDTKIIKKIQTWKGFEKFDGKNPNYLGEGKFFEGCKHPVLFQTIEMDDFEAVKELIKAGADVNFIDPVSKISPLLAFSEKIRHRAEITKELINAGADVNYMSIYKLDSDNILDTPLMDACKDDCVESIRALVKAGADVNFQDKYGLTPLCRIDEGSKHYNLISKILINAGADVNDCGGFLLQRAIGESKLEAIKVLMDAGAKLDIPSPEKFYNDNGRTALMSFLNGEADGLGGDEEEELFLLFCKNIGDVNVQDNDGRSLIFYALDTCIGGDDFDLLILESILFKENIDINLTDKEQNIALNTFLLAIEKEGDSSDELCDDERCKIETFLIAGSNVEIENDYGDSSKIIAKRIGNKDIQSLIEKSGELINTENRMGQTPLFIASLQGHTEKVKWLIKKGSYINAKNKCHKISRGMEVYGTVFERSEETIKPRFYTSLMAAQNIEIVKVLIKAGADINEQNSDGNAALMLYTKDNWLEGVEELISAGADANLVNKWYETALTIAKKNSKSKTKHYKQTEKLINLLQGNTTKKFIPFILSSLFCMFK